MKIPAWKTMYWLVKREFWEHRGGFFWAPLISGGVFLVLNLMALITGEVLGGHNAHFNSVGGIDFGGHPGGINLNGNIDADMLGKIGTGLDIAMYAVAGIVLMIMAVIVFFYCLGSLYDDRRDRSILFWKSLPISNRATVLCELFVVSFGAVCCELFVVSCLL